VEESHHPPVRVSARSVRARRLFSLNSFFKDFSWCVFHDGIKF
jgi:hypothetical protein